MGSLIKLANPRLLGRELRVKEWGSVDLLPTPSYMGVQFGGQPKVSKVSGKDQGEVDLEEKLHHQARYEIFLANVRPLKYHGLVEVNPELHRLGQVGHVSVLEPAEAVDLFFTFQPFGAVDLTKLDWYVRLYLLD